MVETPTEISAAGYTDLNIGGGIHDRWLYIEFQTAADAKIIRIPTSDARVTHTTETSKYVTYTVALTGADTDIAALGLPQTFAKAAFKKTDSDVADIMGVDAFSATATLSSSADTLTVTVNAGILPS